MKTDRSLNFLCHLLILFIYQFQSSEKSTKSIISIKKSKKSVITFHFRNLHAVQAGQCFLMRVANIWSRLLKHNWWNPLYGRVRTHSNVFLALYSTKIHLCTAISADQPYVARISAHGCVWPAIMTSISSL